MVSGFLERLVARQVLPVETRLTVHHRLRVILACRKVPCHLRSRAGLTEMGKTHSILLPPLCLCVGVLEPRTENATLAAQVIFWRENDLGSNDHVWPRPKWHSEMLKTRSEITRAMQHWHPTHNWKTNSVGEKPKWAGRLHADTLNHEK